MEKQDTISILVSQLLCKDDEIHSLRSPTLKASGGTAIGQCIDSGKA
jgi:hypothetical protein